MHLIAGLVGTLQSIEIYDFGAQNKAVEKCISFFYASKICDFWQFCKYTWV